MRPRGSRTRRLLREQVAHQQAERFVRLVRRDPPPPPQESAVDTLIRWLSEPREEGSR